MAIQGLRSTADFVADQRPKNWREGYLRLEPNGMASLVALTAAMKSRSVDDPEYNWWEKRRETRRFALHATNGDLTTSNTTLVLAAGSKGTMLKDGDVLRVEQTGEIIQVNGNPTNDTQIVVTRGAAGSTPATLDADGSGINPNLLYIGSAYEEGSLSPTSVRYDPVKVTNFTQIFRDSLAHTRTAMKTRLRTPDDVKEAKKDCFEYHVQGIERAFWFSKKFEGTRNGEPCRFTDGVLNRIPAGNIHDVSSDYSTGLTMEGLEQYLHDIFKEGSSEKMGFCGNAALMVINQVVRKNSTFNIQSGIKEFGMDVTRLTCPFGELVLKTHKMFNQIPGGVNTTAYYGMANSIVVLDMANLEYVYLDGSDTQFEADLTPKGLDAKKAGYLSECAVSTMLAETHHWLRNIHAAAADA